MVTYLAHGLTDRYSGVYEGINPQVMWVRRWGQASLLDSQRGAFINRVTVNRIAHQVGSIMQVEFAHHVGSIACDGPHIDAELFRDVLIQRALSYHVENLLFGRRQAVMV